jgi:hypothetical protein
VLLCPNESSAAPTPPPSCARTRSIAQPFATPPTSTALPAASVARVRSTRRRSGPTSARAAAIASGAGSASRAAAACHSATSGPTVTSNAPRVARDSSTERASSAATSGSSATGPRPAAWLSRDTSLSGRQVETRLSSRSTRAYASSLARSSAARSPPTSVSSNTVPIA